MTLLLIGFPGTGFWRADCIAFVITSVAFG